MGIVQLFPGKMFTLLCIWIPSYDLQSKLEITCMWLIIFLVNIDFLAPGHSGKIYKLLKNMHYEIREIILTGIQLALAIIFEHKVLSACMWVVAFPGTLAVVMYMVQMFSDLRDLVRER